MPSLVQRQFQRYPGLGYPGDLARPEEPHAFDLGLAHVPANGRKPQPGDAVYYDEAENAFAVPTDAAQVRAAVGIVSFDPGVIQQARAGGVPTGSNSDQFVQFEDGDPIKVCIAGTVWILAGSAMKYGQLVQWDSGNNNFEVYAPDLEVPAAFADLAAARTAVNDVVEELRRRVVECVSPSPVADNGLAQVRIGYGRIV